MHHIFLLDTVDSKQLISLFFFKHEFLFVLYFVADTEALGERPGERPRRWKEFFAASSQQDMKGRIWGECIKEMAGRNEKEKPDQMTADFRKRPAGRKSSEERVKIHKRPALGGDSGGRRSSLGIWIACVTGLIILMTSFLFL